MYLIFLNVIKQEHTETWLVDFQKQIWSRCLATKYRVKSVRLVGGCGFVDVDPVFDEEADDINQIFFVL